MKDCFLKMHKREFKTEMQIRFCNNQNAGMQLMK